MIAYVRVKFCLQEITFFAIHIWFATFTVRCFTYEPCNELFYTSKHSDYANDNGVKTFILLVDLLRNKVVIAVLVAKAMHHE